MDLSLTFADDATPALATVAQSFARADLPRVMFQSIAAIIQTHFLALDAQRHRSTVDGPGFYAQAAQAISEVDLGDDTFTVAIDQPGLAQRYYGGTITAGTGPNGARMLTIPAIPEALGRRAGDFTNLKCIFFRSLDLGALVEASPTGAVRDEPGRLPVVFWLKRSVTQAADPSVLPDPDDLQAAAHAAAADFLSATWQDGVAPLPESTVSASDP